MKSQNIKLFLFFGTFQQMKISQEVLAPSIRFKNLYRLPVKSMGSENYKINIILSNF